MTRRSAIVVAISVAVAAAAELVVLSSLLASERAGDRSAYAEAIAAQRRAAGRAVAAAEVPPTSADRTLCVRGVDTFAAAAQRNLGLSAIDDRGHLDPAMLAALSRIALSAERYAEHGARPALPQRMGRLWPRGPAAAPAGELCDGALAFAQARVAVPAGAAAPGSAVAATKPARAAATKRSKPTKATKPATPKKPATPTTR
jgi:hypothetical protein